MEDSIEDDPYIDVDILDFAKDEFENDELGKGNSSSAQKDGVIDRMTSSRTTLVAVGICVMVIGLVIIAVGASISFNRRHEVTEGWLIACVS